MQFQSQAWWGISSTPALGGSEFEASLAHKAIQDSQRHRETLSAKHKFQEFYTSNSMLMNQFWNKRQTYCDA